VKSEILNLKMKRYDTRVIKLAIVNPELVMLLEKLQKSLPRYSIRPRKIEKNSIKKCGEK